MSTQAAVLAANESFYHAFATRDLNAMEAIWAHGESVACIHPGWNPLRTREQVIASWAEILAGDGAPEIRWAQASAFVHGDMAFVVCDEILPGGVLAATNIFVREQGDWKICHHHAAPVAQPQRVRTRSRSHSTSGILGGFGTTGSRCRLGPEL